MKNNLIEEKSFEFSVRIVKLCRHLNAEKKEYALTNQLLRSGTSIGANVSEAQKGQSLPDFNAKMAIALKEANETQYWLRLMHRTECLTDAEFKSIYNDASELTAILTAICKKTNR